MAAQEELWTHRNSSHSSGYEYGILLKLTIPVDSNQKITSWELPGSWKHRARFTVEERAANGTFYPPILFVSMGSVRSWWGKTGLKMPRRMADPDLR